MKEFIQVFTFWTAFIGAFLYVIFFGYPAEPYDLMIGLTCAAAGIICGICGLFLAIRETHRCRH